MGDRHVQEKSWVQGEKQDKYESELSIKLYCGTVWENLSVGGLETTCFVFVLIIASLSLDHFSCTCLL